jgi:hypothetical protein
MTTSINISNAIKQNTSSTEWKEVNVTSIDSKTVQTIESATVQQRTSKKGRAYLVCVLRLKDGSTSQMPLTRHWEFQRGDTLDVHTITFCHLADDKKKLKTNTSGEPEVYIYGELE